MLFFTKVELVQGKRMKFLKITTILTKLPKLLTGVSALD